jgi:glycosyltransferase involved in cell wall biosynthesis
MISILILTKDEENNIGECIGSLSGFDDITVLDSLSGDRTCEIARKCGAHIVERPFDNWSQHQNWALKNIKFKNKWVLYLDADERLTPLVIQEINEKIKNVGDKYSAFWMRRENYFLGKHLRFCYPSVWLMRLFRPDKLEFHRLVNPTASVDGLTGKIYNMFLHYNFSKGIHEWIQKHNNYSTLEAEEAMKIIDSGKLDFIGLIHRDQNVRRSALKQLSFRLPCRGILRFIYLYFMKFGFLDGYPGYIYCTLMSQYEFQIDLKIIEMKRKRNNLPV